MTKTSIASAHEMALEGLQKQIDGLRAAIQSEQPLTVPFRTAKLAMETMAVSASDNDKLLWADIALAVANIAAGELQAEAYALAYRLVHPLT